MKIQLPLKAIFLAVLSLCVSATYAQDIIKMKDGSKMKVRIVEVTGTEIKFYKVGSTDLNTYFVDKNDAAGIQYENGDVTTFQAKEELNDKEADEQRADINYVQFRGRKFRLVDKSGFVVKYKMSHEDLVEQFSENKQAYEYYQQYRGLKVVKHVFTGVAITGMVIGYPLFFSGLGSGSDGQETVGIALAAGGMACFILRIPFAVTAGSRAGKAADTYNYGLKKRQQQYSLELGATPNGAGLIMRF